MIHMFLALAAASSIGFGAGAQTGNSRAFDIPSADGTPVHGQADLPFLPSAIAVLMVAGTGPFDRDAKFGRSGTTRDKLFKDLAARVTERGGMAVRYDKRGIGYNGGGPVKQDYALLGKVTTEAMLQDLRAVYDWTGSAAGLGAKCVVVFAHSEGMVHVGRLAASGAPAPAAVIGMGAAMESPVADVRWQMAERDAYSLEILDTNHDGVTSNEEVEAGWRQTPSGALDNLGPLLHPSGGWSRADLNLVRAAQTSRYEQMKKAALAQPDDAPYPSPSAPFASYQWWKSWFLDNTAVAENLKAWKTPVMLHYGTYDSQTHAENEVAAAKAFIPTERLTVEMHLGGHSLGKHPLYGPINERVADQIADEALAACKR